MSSPADRHNAVPSNAHGLARQLLSAVAVERPELLPLCAQILDRLSPCRHSPDFASIVWFGQRHSFTGNQAAIVRLLWEAWRDGTLDVRSETLLSAADSESGRLVDVFKGHAAWSTVIKPGEARGTYRLSEA